MGVIVWFLTLGQLNTLRLALVYIYKFVITGEEFIFRATGETMDVHKKINNFVHDIREELAERADYNENFTVTCSFTDEELFMAWFALKQYSNNQCVSSKGRLNAARLKKIFTQEIADNV